MIRWSPFRSSLAMNFPCKNCSVDLFIPPQYMGRRVRCPNCAVEVDTKEFHPDAECEHCWAEFRVKFDLLRKKLKCPQCKRITRIMPKSPRINVTCSKCDQSLSIPQKTLGWNVRCPKCNEMTKAIEADAAAFIEHDPDRDYLVVERLEDLAEGRTRKAKAPRPVAPTSPLDSSRRTKKRTGLDVAMTIDRGSASHAVPTAKRRPVNPRPPADRRQDSDAVEPKPEQDFAPQAPSSDSMGSDMAGATDASQSIYLTMDDFASGIEVIEPTTPRAVPIRPDTMPRKLSDSQVIEPYEPSDSSSAAAGSSGRWRSVETAESGASTLATEPKPAYEKTSRFRKRSESKIINVIVQLFAILFAGSLAVAGGWLVWTYLRAGNDAPALPGWLFW